MQVAFIKTKLSIMKTKLAFIVYNRDKRSLQQGGRKFSPCRE
jgi:hypothetical protein